MLIQLGFCRRLSCHCSFDRKTEEKGWGLSLKCQETNSDAAVHLCLRRTAACFYPERSEALFGKGCENASLDLTKGDMPGDHMVVHALDNIHESVRL